MIEVPANLDQNGRFPDLMCFSGLNFLKTESI